MIQGIILAAGKGSRMKTNLPKCAYPILGKPMIQYSIAALKSASIDDIIIVVGHKHSAIKETVDCNVRFAYQEKQLGTGDAVKAALDLIDDNKVCLIMLGDCPLIGADEIRRLINAHVTSNSALTVATTVIDNPSGYGRIIKDENNNLMAIIEERDLSEKQRTINEINCGLYCVNSNVLKSVIYQIDNKNFAQEFYLTDLVKILYNKVKISTENFDDFSSFIGVNDLYNLSVVEEKISSKIKKNHMMNGVRITYPDSVLIEDTVILEKGTVIMPNTIIRGNSIIGENAIIGPNTEIVDSLIGSNSNCRHSVIINSKVGCNTQVGPFAHLRQNCNIGNKNRIGNFVEIKKTITGENTKIAHLAYLGDCNSGSNVNFGCGSITVNYDGKIKHKTTIGNNVFVGCNTNLIAPITLEDNAFIAAGSTVYKDVPNGNLAISRVQQINKKGYQKR